MTVDCGGGVGRFGVKDIERVALAEIQHAIRRSMQAMYLRAAHGKVAPFILCAREIAGRLKATS